VCKYSRYSVTLFKFFSDYFDPNVQTRFNLLSEPLSILKTEAFYILEKSSSKHTHTHTHTHNKVKSIHSSFSSESKIYNIYINIFLFYFAYIILQLMYNKLKLCN